MDSKVHIKGRFTVTSSVTPTTTRRLLNKKDVASRTDSGIAGLPPRSKLSSSPSFKVVTGSPKPPAASPQKPFMNSPQVRKLLGEPKKSPSPGVKASSPARSPECNPAEAPKNLTPKKPVRKSPDVRNYSHADVQDRKVIELKNEIQVLRTLTLERDKQITQLEDIVSTLRLENEKLRSEALNAQKHNGDIQETYSKKYRGSLSRLEAHLDEHSNESSARFETLSMKHKKELEDVKLLMAKKQEEWLDLIDSKTADISTLSGRLEEARNSRQSTLDEMKSLSKNYNNSIKQLEDALHSLLKKYTTCQKEKEAIMLTQAQVEEKLRKSLHEKHRLSSRLEVASSETSEKQKKIEELDSIVTRLEQSLSSFDMQKAQLLESTKEYMETGHKRDIECGTTNALKDQLEKCQSRLDSTKDLLTIQKQKSKELEKSNDELDQQLTMLKVDLRIMTRERKDLETKLASKTLETLGLTSSCSALKLKMTEIEDTAKQHQCRINHLESKSVQDDFSISELKTKLLEKDHERIASQDKLDQLVAENKNLLTRINELQALTGTVEEKDRMIEETERLLESKDRKISDLRTNIKVLKDACIVLEEQLKEFEVAIVQKCSQINELTSSRSHLTQELENTREELSTLQDQLTKTTSSKLFAEQKLHDLEYNLKLEGNSKNIKIQSLTEKASLLQKTNSNLSDQLDQITTRFTETEATRLCLSKVLENLRSENMLIKDQASRQITEGYNLKEKNSKLLENFDVATRQIRSYELELEAKRAKLEALSREKEEDTIKYKATLEQQTKLIEYLQQQNELLCSKKKKTFTEKIFGREKEGNHQQSHFHQSTQISVANSTQPETVPGLPIHLSHQQPLFIDNTAAPVTVRKEDCILLQLSEVLTSISEANTKGIAKSVIFKQSGPEKLYVNCVKNIFDDLFIFGCEEGLFSARPVDDNPVKIDGVGSIHQIEFITNINFALMTEGKDRRLGLVHLGLLRTCAEATESYKPKIKLQMLADQESCDLFRVGRTSSEKIVLVVATMKTLNVLFWEKDSFVQKMSLRTPQSVTCISITPTSVIYGSDKIFELDLTNFTVEEFLDESDESLLYVKTTCRNSANYPVAIVEITSESTLHGDMNRVAREYLLCFSDVGIFTDAFGRRSRDLNIVWSKLPVEVAYKGTDLFVLHFGSVEIIRITPISFTKEKLGETVSNIPKPKHLQLGSPRLLGVGKRNPSAYIGSFSNTETTVYEVTGPTE